MSEVVGPLSLVPLKKEDRLQADRCGRRITSCDTWYYTTFLCTERILRLLYLWPYQQDTSRTGSLVGVGAWKCILCHEFAFSFDLFTGLWDVAPPPTWPLPLP